jgi:hypothetical protein
MATALEQVMAISVARTVGKLPHPLDRTPQVKHPLVTVRALTGDRYYQGRVPAPGEVITLPDYEAAAWVRLGWAEKL